MERKIRMPSVWGILLSGQAYGKAGGGEVLLGFGNRVFTKMEDTGGKDGRGVPVPEHIHQVVQVAGPAGGNDGNLNRIREGAGQPDVIAGLGPVSVHAGQQ